MYPSSSPTHTTPTYSVPIVMNQVLDHETESQVAYYNPLQLVDIYRVSAYLLLMCDLSMSLFTSLLQVSLQCS